MSVLKRQEGLLTHHYELPTSRVINEDSEDFTALLLVKEFLEYFGFKQTVHMLIAESAKDLHSSRNMLLEEADIDDDTGDSVLVQLLQRYRAKSSVIPATVPVCEPEPEPEPVKTHVKAITRVDDEELPGPESSRVKSVVSSSKYVEPVPEDGEDGEDNEDNAATKVEAHTRVQRLSGGITRSSKGWDTKEDDSNDFEMDDEPVSTVQKKSVLRQSDLSLEDLADFEDSGNEDEPASKPKAPSKPEADYVMDESSGSFEESEEVETSYNPSKSVMETTSGFVSRKTLPPAPETSEDIEYGEDFDESIEEDIDEDIEEFSEKDGEDGEDGDLDLSEDTDNVLRRSTGGALKTLPKLEEEKWGSTTSKYTPSAAVPRQQDAGRSSKVLEESLDSEDMDALSVGAASEDEDFFSDKPPAAKKGSANAHSSAKDSKNALEFSVSDNEISGSYNMDHLDYVMQPKRGGR
jgi:hypothetical protein